MRDTLIIFVIILAVIGLVLWNQPSAVAPSGLVTQGVKNEGNPDAHPRANPSAESQTRRKSSRVAVKRTAQPSEESSAQGEALPSIYSSQKLKTDSKDKKVVLGVPLQDFLAANQNWLPTEVSAEAPQGVRVFLQCMELRSGKPSELNEKECKEIATRNQVQSKRYDILGGL